MKNEIWKTIEDYPDYQVSNYGRIKSLKFGKERILKQQKRGEYLQVNISKDGKCNSKRVHILVFETHNNYKLKHNDCIHHIDFNQENNIFENLKLMSKSEHKSLHGKNYSEKTKKKISEHHVGMVGKHHSEETRNKISESQPNKISNQKVAEIRLDIKECVLTYREIGKRHNVSVKTVQKIKGLEKD